jgi:hypothetical protein
MPTEIKITAYKFHELNNEAKEKARTKLSEWITDHEWWDFIYENAKQDGEAKGFEINDIRFTGFWSQGDGAYWTGRVNLHTFVESQLDERSAWYGEDVILLALLNEGWIDRWISIGNRNYRYSHSAGMVLEEYPNNMLDLDPDDGTEMLEGPLQGASVYQLKESFDFEARITEWCDEALEQARAFADDIYKKLEDEYNGLTSEESLSEFADANEYLFDERGEML